MHGVIERRQKIIHLALFFEHFRVKIDQLLLKRAVFSVRIVYFESDRQQTLIGLYFVFFDVSGILQMIVYGLPRLDETVLAVHLRVQVKIDEHILAIDKAQLLGSDHDIMHKTSRSAQTDHAEFVANVVLEYSVDGPRVLLVSNLVVHVYF